MRVCPAGPRALLACRTAFHAAPRPARRGSKGAGPSASAARSTNRRNDIERTINRLKNSELPWLPRGCTDREAARRAAGGSALDDERLGLTGAAGAGPLLLSGHPPGLDDHRVALAVRPVR